MENKQTAVEWLFQRMNEIRVDDECERLSVVDFFNLQFEAKEQAKKMHKEEIGRAYQEGLIDGMNHSPKDYYNETYGYGNGK
jgi:hypothetical protein